MWISTMESVIDCLASDRGMRRIVEAAVPPHAQGADKTGH
jgi:hypothetical protein